MDQQLTVNAMPVPSPYQNQLNGSSNEIQFRSRSDSRNRDESLSLRTELLSPTPSQANQNPPVSARRRRRSGHRRGDELEKRSRGVTYSSGSASEILALLVDQEREAAALRRLYNTACERLNAETERALLAEQANQETVNHFKLINESRLLAQQEATKANEQLMMYQLQLENAQNEIDRAQGILNVLQRQKQEAEESAARARTEARQLKQQQVIDAAREEGRRYGFEAGIRRARHEREIKAGRSQTVPRTLYDIPPFPEETTPRPVVYKQPPLHVAEDSLLSEGHHGSGNNGHAWSELGLQDLDNSHSPYVVRLNDANRSSRPASPSPSSDSLEELPVTAPRSQPPYPEVAEAPIPEPIPGFPRTETPSVHNYRVEVPTEKAAEHAYVGGIKPKRLSIRKRIQNQLLRRDSERTVPPRQHGRYPPDNYIPSDGTAFPPAHSFGDPRSASSQAPSLPWDARTNNSITASQQIRNNADNESWYKRRNDSDYDHGSTLRSIPPAEGSTAQPKSWYQRRPSIRIRDYAFHKRGVSNDTESNSTRLSDLELVAPPGSKQIGEPIKKKERGGLSLWRKIREKQSKMSVIKEDANSRQASPAVEHFPQNRQENARQASPSPLRDRPTSSRLRVVGEKSSEEREPRYSDPRTMEEWRRSSATPPKLELPLRPSRGSSPSQGAPHTPPLSRLQDRSLSEDPRQSTSRSHHSSRDLGRRAMSNAARTPPNINVQSPSRSPSDAQDSPLSDNELLSPTSETRRRRTAHSASASTSALPNPGSYSVGSHSAPKSPLRHDLSLHYPNQSQESWRPPPLPTTNRGASSTSVNRQYDNWTHESMQPPLPVPPPNFHKSSTSLDHKFPSAGSAAEARTPRPDKPSGQSSSTGLQRMPSRGSMKSAGTYGTFDPKTYIDPAYFPSEPPIPGAGRTTPVRPHSRMSGYTGLSYVSS